MLKLGDIVQNRLQSNLIGIVVKHEERHPAFILVQYFSRKDPINYSYTQFSYFIKLS